jgi:hypothetical protein
MREMSRTAEEDDYLSPEQSRQLQALFELQNQRRLSPEERKELDLLVATYGRELNERGIRDLAALRGVPVDQLRAEVLAETERALAWWQEVQADPVRMAEVIREVRDHH